MKETKKKRGVYWLCICDCGGERSVERRSLTTTIGTKSCGCLRSGNTATRKGMTYKKSIRPQLNGVPKCESRLYSIWSAMKYRCSNPNSTGYKNYGGRGIKVCERWLEFDNFIIDMNDAYVQFKNEHGENTASIERIDVNGNYDIENCIWIHIHEQSKNRRSSIKLFINGKKYESLVEIANEYDIPITTIKGRYKSGKRGDELIYKK